MNNVFNYLKKERHEKQLKSVEQIGFFKRIIKTLRNKENNFSILDASPTPAPSAPYSPSNYGTYPQTTTQQVRSKVVHKRRRRRWYCCLLLMVF